MTPTQMILQKGCGSSEISDNSGRHLTVRHLGALDTLRLFKAAGPNLAQNEPWLSMAALAFAVTAIDGVPVPTPSTEAQIESVIEKLGDDGLRAIADSIAHTENSSMSRDMAGNSHGTLS